jgi:hypothetical protein
MRVSFDFDGTLADHFDGAPNDQRYKVIERLKQHQREGDEVFIVTKRYSPQNSRLGLVNEHIDPLRLASELSIPGDRIVFTDRSLKADKLHDLGINQHYEDCPHEADYFIRRFPSSDMIYVMVSCNPWQTLTPGR